MRRDTRRSAEQWAELVAAYWKSDESEESFCRRHRLGQATFRKWRYRLGAQTETAEPSAAASGFVEVVPRGDVSDERVTVHVGDGISLDYPVSRGVESIARLVLALRDGR